MKADVAKVCPWRQRDTEGLNATVEVLVIQGIFIVPDTGRGISYFITEEPDTVVTRIGLELRIHR